MRPLLAALIAVTAFTIGATHSLAEQVPSVSQSEFVDKLFQPWDTSTSPGCAVAVLKDGKTLYHRGYGMADLEHDIKITPSTVFLIGSMSKQFTAAAVLMLAQQGKASLDDPIRKYVPEVPDFGTPITLRELLHHTSGLRDQWQLLNLDGWRLWDDLITDGDVLYLVSRQKELNFPPGTDFMYCNTEYTLLAQVVDRVSGHSLRQFTTANLFEPLAMKQTHFRDSHDEIVGNLAYGYQESNKDYQLNIPDVDTVGSAGVVSTVEDLSRWDENFYTAEVGGQDFIRQLQEGGKLNDGTPLHYAAGLYIYEYRGLKVVDHSGDEGGYVADLMRFPEQHFSAVTLCNVSSIDPTEMNRRIADIYLAGELKPVPGREAPVALSQDQLSSKAGLYISEPEDRLLLLEAKDGALWADFNYLGSAKLESLSESRFAMQPLWRIDFVDDSHLVWTSQSEEMGSDRPIGYRRVPAFAPTTAELRDFAGKYRSPELDVPYFLTVENGQLMMHWPKKQPLLLQPVTTDLFVNIPGWRLRFTRDQRRHVAGFVLNTTRLSNFRFDRVEQTSDRSD
jgi:CubicO group peptidase (beta-lactamase class C family)